MKWHRGFGDDLQHVGDPGFAFAARDNALQKPIHAEQYIVDDVAVGSDQHFLEHGGKAARETKPRSAKRNGPHRWGPALFSW